MFCQIIWCQAQPTGMEFRVTVVLMAIFKKNTTSESVEPMNCKEVRLFIPLFVLGGQEMTLDEWFALDDHIQSCPRCAKEYEETRFVIESIEHQRTDLINKGIFSEPAEEDTRRELTDEENLQEIWDRVERSEARKHHNRNVKQVKCFFKTSAAVAACLVIGVLTWMVFSNYSKPQTFPQDSSSQQVAFVSKPFVKVELVTNTGNIPIPSNQQITSTGQFKTLLINDKHRLMMNTNTVLTVEPFVENSDIGCLVKLASGRIYTHVEHDGNPFIVDTAHGQAVITGTTFDVKVTDNSMTLIVSEGTVQFESQEGAVNVTAGQTSEIVGQSAPSIPLSCNTAELTAWATGYKPGPALAQTESSTDLWHLSLPLGKEPIILEETNYESWVEQKRDWFEQEILWIFQLREALAKEGIEVDYPKLLIKTGDVWQFICLGVSPALFSVVDFDSLLKTASDYDFDKHWLLKNVSAAKYAFEKPVLSGNSFTGLKAFERWLGYLDETKKLKPPTPIYSYHARKYLTNTRSLIWFVVKGGQYDLTNEERAEVLTLLQEEVRIACICQNNVLYPPDKQRLSWGEEDKYRKSTVDIIQGIKTIFDCENNIQEILKEVMSMDT